MFEEEIPLRKIAQEGENDCFILEGLFEARLLWSWFDDHQ